MQGKDEQTPIAKDMIIIGAGIAGLSTGCYAQMNGYSTRIYELHAQPGGVCTAWKLKGFTFDGCIHNLAGTSAARSWKVIDRDVFTRIEDPDGKALTFYADIDRLEGHLKELAPADTEVINAYIKAARHFTRFDLTGMLTAGPAQMLKMAPQFPALIKWKRINLDAFSDRCTDPFLRRAFRCVQYDMAGMHNKDLGWKGGSLAFARVIAGRYEKLGGKIDYHSPVEKILAAEGTKRSRAAGSAWPTAPSTTPT